LSNAMCFKPDNNVCACAVSALILLLVEMDSVPLISFMTSKFLLSDAAFHLL